MKAIAVIPGKKESAHLVDVERPQIDRNEVLVKVLEVGINGTDSEIHQGLYGEPPRGSDFLVIGHESFGIVEEVGPEVDGFKQGDYVVATVRRPDGCINCRIGEYDMCVTGQYTERGIKGGHGYLIEYYKERPEYLVKIPATLREVGVLLEPASIVEKAIYQVYKIQERLVWEANTALVTGTGTIGLLAAALLRMRGLEVIAVDRTDFHEVKNELFERVAVTHINSKRIPVRNLPRELKKNISLVIEATGNSTVALESMHVIGNNGIVCLASVTGGTNRVEICADCLNLELVLGNKVVFGTVNANRTHFEQGIADLMRLEKAYPGLLEKLITARVPIENFSKALELLNDRSQIKVVVEVGREGL